MGSVEKDEMPSLSRRLAQLSPQTSQHSIYRVPGHLRDVNSKAYEPQIVAIGPYNRGNPKLKQIEELKLRYMQALLNRKLESVRYYTSGIEEESKRARGCYEESSINLNDNEFSDMLVLDGCFIIEVIQDHELFSQTFPNRSSLGILKRDLILLENQIPFFVVCKLFDLIVGPDQHSFLMELILKFCQDVFPGKILYKATTMRISEEIQHILDLIHSNWCPPPYNSSDQVDDQGCCASWCCPTKTISRVVIPSASELKDANVKFHHKEYDIPPDSNIIFQEDRCTSLFDVEFNNSGKMVMPKLVIDDGTESLLRNLIAYEHVFPLDKPSYVVDYQILLDCLINTPKDVQILCGANIIQNLLGSDQEVVEWVNKLGDGVAFYEDNFVYADKFRQINVHHRKCWNRAVAALHRDYFKTPWAYIAFLGALMLFLLTAAQTVFSVLQL